MLPFVCFWVTLCTYAVEKYFISNAACLFVGWGSLGMGWLAELLRMCALMASNPFTKCRILALYTGVPCIPSVGCFTMADRETCFETE